MVVPDSMAEDMRTREQANVAAKLFGVAHGVAPYGACDYRCWKSQNKGNCSIWPLGGTIFPVFNQEK
jgi:hypothetical protein